MTPLLIVALIIWAGVFLFMWSIDRRIRAAERRIAQRLAEDVGERDPARR